MLDIDRHRLLDELRTGRELRRRRDGLIRRLSDSGVKVGPIAVAAGVSVTRIKEILDVGRKSDG